MSSLLVAGMVAIGGLVHNGPFLERSGDWKVLSHQAIGNDGRDAVKFGARVQGGPALTKIVVEGFTAAAPFEGQGLRKTYNLELYEHLDRIVVFQLSDCDHPSSTYQWSGTITAEFWTGSILVETMTITHALDEHP